LNLLTLIANVTMLNRYFTSSAAIALIACLCASTSLKPTKAHAQQCDAPYETITRLHHPEPGAFMVWNTVYGEEGREEAFSSAVAKEGGHILAVGEVYQTKKVRPQLLMVEFDRRGRKVWEKIHKVAHIDKIVKVLADGDGYVVIANLHPPEKKKIIWLGFFDKQGSLKSQKTMRTERRNLTASDIQPMIDGGGWIVPMTSSIMLDEKEGIEQKNTSLIIIDKDGKEKNSRSYILGKKTELSSVSVSNFEGEDEGYIATGWFENNNGKKIGWVLRLDPDLSIAWQKEFSRGVSANVVSSIIADKQTVYVAADVKAADSISGGVWLAALNWGSGDINWQRYYMSDEQKHGYTVRGVDVNQDGLIALLMMAQANPDAHKAAEEDVVDQLSGFGISSKSDYAHMLTLTPRGITLSGDAFYKGEKAFLSQLVQNDLGQRVMVGDVLVELEPELDPVESEEARTGIVPLNENSEISLPDVELSDKTKQGLALLQKKIEAQDIIDQKHDDAVHDDDAEESAMTDENQSGFVRKGWVVVGDMSDPYKDPCK